MNDLQAQLEALKAENARLQLEKEVALLRAENEKLAKRQVKAAQRREALAQAPRPAYDPRPALITKENIAEFLATKPRERVVQFVGKALCRLYERQTQDEQGAKRTQYVNARGFRAGGDDKAGTAAAEYYLAHGTLTEEMLQAWTKPDAKGKWPRLCAYDRQLNECAWEKRDSETAAR